MCTWLLCHVLRRSLRQTMVRGMRCVQPRAQFCGPIPLGSTKFPVSHKDDAWRLASCTRRFWIARHGVVGVDASQPTACTSHSFDFGVSGRPRLSTDRAAYGHRRYWQEWRCTHAVKQTLVCAAFAWPLLMRGSEQAISRHKTSNPYAP